jgi:O-acetyl-ADP-ribose deacetylase (regulator of RNase III)
MSFFCRQNFKNVGALLEQGARVGHIAVLEHEGRYIYYLVTKKYSTEKPRLEDLFSSLEKMREHCAEHSVKYVAMPRIGCGLDRLEWRDVKPKIEEIFSRLDISITVYNFNQVNYVLQPECCSVLCNLYDVMDEDTDFVLPKGVNRWHVWAS